MNTIAMTMSALNEAEQDETKSASMVANEMKMRQ